MLDLPINPRCCMRAVAGCFISLNERFSSIDQITQHITAGLTTAITSPMRASSRQCSAIWCWCCSSAAVFGSGRNTDWATCGRGNNALCNKRTLAAWSGWLQHATRPSARAWASPRIFLHLPISDFIDRRLSPNS